MFSNLIKLALVAGLITANADNLQLFYEELMAVTQKVATAGDLRSITSMLDYTFMKKGRYPQTGQFPDWMATHFKENEIKSLTVDHWGNELMYEASEKQKKFTLTSRGPDGVLGTDDDMKITGP